MSIRRFFIAGPSSAESTSSTTMIGDSLRGEGADEVIGTGTGGFSATLTATLSAVGGWAAGA